MMRIILLIVLCVFTFHFALYSQKEATVWYFGERAGIDFSFSLPKPLTDGQMDAIEGCSSICDSDGKLLFYSNGISVWNRKHQIIVEGVNLAGRPSAVQTALSIKQPGFNNRYYVFSMPEVESGNTGSYYSVVDIYGDNGNAAVTEKNVLMDVNTTEKITAVKHENGTDYWIIQHLAGTEYKAVLLDRFGISTQPILSEGIVSFSTTSWDASGYMKVSPDGKKIATCRRGNSEVSEVEICDFDNNTGKVSNPKKVVFPLLTYGLEFSPNGHYLYVACGRTSNVSELYQVDLLNENEYGEFKKSLITLTNDKWYGALQIAPDHKIYLAIMDSPYLGVINFPDNEGIQCGFEQQGFYLAGRKSRLGLPSFVQSFFAREETPCENLNIAKTLPNLYYKVTAISNEKKSITVSNSEKLCPKDLVLIVQMQGAEILKDDNSDYGKIQSLNSTGNYEFARIQSINGTAISFEKPLTRTYIPNSKVQLVTVPEFEDLIVSSPLTCQPWNGDIGGVLAFTVKNTLYVNSHIDVTGVGFRGGRSVNSVTTPNSHVDNYVATPDSTQFSRKGEGIYGWLELEDLAGRGAAASGGGGGNNHNAGGGGGSNAGCGGKGGYGWNEFKGDRETSQGLGGRPILTDENKVFLGGGGGAGHSNELTGTDGANGGGIVVIKAKRIVSNNGSIASRGQSSKNAAYDGVGGGGAGGTVMIDCEQVINNVVVSVKGGSGGSTTEHRDGPGGGGGGGFIYFSGSENQKKAEIELNGGGCGTNKDFNPDGATSGCPGIVKNNIEIPGVNDLTNIVDLSSYNKTQSLLNIISGSTDSYIIVESDEDIFLSDVLGKNIFPQITRSSLRFYIDTSSLPNGLYYISNGLDIKRFVVFR